LKIRLFQFLLRVGIPELTKRFTFKSTITNPAVTAQIMVSSARAAMKQQPGNYLLPEIAPIDLLEGDDRDQLLRRLV
jgi:diaminopimelate dehydrogenase